MTLTYGMAQTDIATNTDRTKMVGVVAGILGANAYVKSDLSVANIGKGNSYTFTTYDNLANDVSTSGVRWLPSLHSTSYTVPPSDGIVSDPVGTGGMQGWYEFVTASCNRYGPGGTFAHAGWQNVTAWELWNEPNGVGDTGTSLGGYSGAFTLDQNGVKRLSVATLYRIIKDGANAIKAHGVAHSYTPSILAYGSNSIDLVYLQALISQFTSLGDNLFNYLTHFSIHMYETEDPTAPGGNSPAVSSRIRSIENLRTVLDNNGGTTCRIWVTEGGYAGADKWNEYQQTFNAITISSTSAANKVLWKTAGHGGGTVPTVSAVTPNTGYVGDTVTISGSAFTGATAVSFNGISTSFAVVNDTTVTASVPSGGASGDVDVSNANGPSINDSPFTVNPPTILTVNPSSGLPNSTIVVSGHGFTDFTVITIGGVNVIPVSASDSSLSLVVPGSLGAGSAVISVTTLSGNDTTTFTVNTNAASVADTFAGRTVASGFGTTSDGTFSWRGIQGNNVQFSVGSGAGLIRMPTLPAVSPIVDMNFNGISGSSVPDVSGNANTGTGKKGPIGGTTNWSPSTGTGPLSSSSIIFDGTALDRIEIPSSASIRAINNFTILSWVKPDFSVDTDPVHQRYEIVEKAGSFWFNVREDTTPRYVLRVGGYFNGTGVETFVGNTPLVTNTWAHVTATYDGANMKTYINASLDQTQAQTGTTNSGATITGIDENMIVGGKHRLGHAAGGSGTNELLEALWNGQMDDYKIYGVALTQPQIWTVMNELTSGSAPIVIVDGFSLSDTDVMVKYQFDTQPTGSTQSIALAMQLSDALNYQRAVVTQTTGGNTNIKIQRQIVNVNTDIVPQTTITAQSAATWYWLRFKAVGSTYSAWVWPDGASQPLTPTVTAIDAGYGSGNTSGTVGLRLQTLPANTNGPVYSVQAFQAATDLSGGGGGTGPVVRKNTSSKDAAAATITGVAPPAGTSDNDVLIAHVGARGSTGAITAAANVGSWTLIGTASDTHGDQIVSAAYWKLASAEGTNRYTFSCTGATTMKVDITGFSGVNTTTPIL